MKCGFVVGAIHESPAQDEMRIFRGTLELNSNTLGRHTGAGRYPAIENAPQSGQNQGVVPLAWGICSPLDTGLRRYDAVFF
jgi:hypothetical protein